MRSVIVLLLVLSFVCVVTPCSAQDQGQFGKVIRIERGAFLPGAGLIKFDELAMGAVDPVYRPKDYGAGSTGVTVFFGGIFQGQAIGPTGQCPPGAMPSGCVVGDPTRPLALDPTAPSTFIARDGSNPRSPSLSGSPRFNGPVSMVFDVDVAGVGLFGGHFNALKSTAIRAYDRNGRLIGGVANLSEGMEYLALVTEDGTERIAGLQFSLVGAEPAGFGIDDLSFAKRSQLDDKQIPFIGDVLREKDVLGGKLGAPPDEGNTTPARTGRGSLSDLFKGEQAEELPQERPQSLGDIFRR